MFSVSSGLLPKSRDSGWQDGVLLNQNVADENE